MSKRVLDVGNCAPDFASISGFLTSQFDCQVDQAHGPQDALEMLRQGDYALVLVNRKFFQDHKNAFEIIKAIKADAELSSVPAMLITNYPDHQDAAEEIGAVRGFGKLEMNAETAERLSPILG